MISRRRLRTLGAPLTSQVGYHSGDVSLLPELFRGSAVAPDEGVSDVQAHLGQSIVPLFFAGCLSCSSAAQSHAKVPVPEKTPGGGYLGLDRNLYPGRPDAAYNRKTFLIHRILAQQTDPDSPTLGQENGRSSHPTTWASSFYGTAGLMRINLEKAKGGTLATALGVADGHAAIQAAKREGFPAGTTIFLDQEQGGRLLQEQADYLFAWTEGVSAGGFHAGA